MPWFNFDGPLKSEVSFLRNLRGAIQIQRVNEKYRTLNHCLQHPKMAAGV